MSWPPSARSCKLLSLSRNNPHRSILSDLLDRNLHRIGEWERSNKTAVYNNFKQDRSDAALSCGDRERLSKMRWGMLV